jgi:hypothetical protein
MSNIIQGAVGAIVVFAILFGAMYGIGIALTMGQQRGIEIHDSKTGCVTVMNETTKGEAEKGIKVYRVYPADCSYKTPTSFAL